MADVSQKVSSQLSLKENTYDGVLNKSISPKQKPPLLPKPQLAQINNRNVKYSPVKKIQTSSQTIISVNNIHNKEIFKEEIQERKETLILNSRNFVESVVKSDSPDSKGGLSEKPPALYPKPKLPPKSNAFRTAKSIVSGNISSCESTPSSPQKSINYNNSVNNTPVRPPRSPKKLLKDNPLEEFQNTLLLNEPQSSPFNFSFQKSKSASLCRSEFMNWTLNAWDKNTKTSLESSEPVKLPSDHKYSSDNKEVSAPTPRPRVKNKSKFHIELDLAGEIQESQIPIYATVDYSKKKNRLINPDNLKKLESNKERLSSSDPLIYCSSPEYWSEKLCYFRIDDEISEWIALNRISECIIDSGDDTNKTNISASESKNVKSSFYFDTDTIGEENYLSTNAQNNNYSSFNSNYNSVTCEEREEHIIMYGKDSSCKASGCTVESEGTKNSISVPVPQSFLYRIVGNATPLKEGIKDEVEQKEGDEIQNNSSFLYRHKSKGNVVNSPNESFEIVRTEDVVDVEGDESFKGSEAMVQSKLEVERSNSEHALSISSNASDTRDSSDSSPRTSTYNEEGINLGKRFPWFGSFGKGSKKRTEKKERCSSQFYASPISLQEHNSMNDCSRTKSLPNIKSNGKAVDGDDNLIHNDWARNTDSLNSEFSTLTHNSDADDDKDSVNEVDVHDKGKRGNKAFLIANELITSEEVFIDVLKLLNVDFRNFVESRNKDKNSVLPQSCLNKILNHLPELQTLNEVLLTDLKKRIQDWENNPKISDVIVKKGAFLKLYTSYIQNFESQTKYLDECVAKYPKFGKTLKEFESLERCKMLSLKNYMLKPVQRIPQYRLLLSDYLKHIDQSSPDYEDTENALKIVSEVADHVNRNLKYGDKNGMLMHFQSLLSYYELIRPGRELIKDGPLEKICRKSVKDRYFILLNDCLLHTTYSKNSLKIHQELPLSGMKVCSNEDDKNRYYFTVYSTTRSFVLCAKSEAERNDWVQSLQNAIEQYISRQRTFMNVRIPETDTFKIGKEAPVWIQDSKVTMCQICTAEFTSLFRRHHCRACGKVICKNCGGSQAPLQYDSFKPHRVCDQCFPILLKDYEDSEEDIYEILKMNNPDNLDIQNIYLSNKAKFVKYTSTTKPKFIPPRLKEVSANDSGSEMNGPLFRKSRKAWKQYWYVLKEHVLYVYRASEDVRALETIPVLGYEVKHSAVNYENVDKNLVFILEHRHQSPIVFHAETEESAERWYKALKKASEFEEMSGS